jgi:hypothetical protein
MITLSLHHVHVHEKQSERHFTFKLCMIFITSYLVKFQKILRGGGDIIHNVFLYSLIQLDHFKISKCIAEKTHNEKM